MKDWIKLIVAAIIFITAAMLFFSPILISVLTDNWWFLLLFTISWIPTFGLLIIVSILINILDD